VRTAILLRTPDGSQRNVSAVVVGGGGGLDSASDAMADAAAAQHDSAADDDDDDEEEEEEASSSPLTITHHGHGGAPEPQPESAGLDVQGAQSPSPSSLPPRCTAPLPPVPASPYGSQSTNADTPVLLSREEARARLASIPLAVGLLFSEAGTTGSPASSAASPSDGVVVTAVKGGQAACLAGLRVGDVLLSLRGHSTSSKAAFLSSLRGARAGDRVPVHLRRDGESIQLELILGGRGCTEQEIEAIRRQAGLE